MESNDSGRLFHMSSQPVMIPGSRSLLSRDERLPLDPWNQYGLQENVFLEINFLRLTHTEIILKEFSLAHHKENKDQFHKLQGQGLTSQEMTNKIEAQFQCRHLRQSRRLRVLHYWWNFSRILWLDSRDSKYRNCNSTNSPIHNHFMCGKFDSKPKSTCCDFPSGAMLWIKEVDMVDSLDALKSS